MPTVFYLLIWNGIIVIFNIYLCLGSGRMKPSVELFGRVAVNHAWDAEEPRMLVAEAKLIPGKF